MTRERAKWMDQASFWTVDAAGDSRETVSADHGFLATPRNASVRKVQWVHMGNVGLTVC